MRIRGVPCTENGGDLRKRLKIVFENLRHSRTVWGVPSPFMRIRGVRGPSRKLAFTLARNAGSPRRLCVYAVFRGPLKTETSLGVSVPPPRCISGSRVWFRGLLGVNLRQPGCISGPRVWFRGLLGVYLRPPGCVSGPRVWFRGWLGGIYLYLYVSMV